MKKVLGIFAHLEGVEFDIPHDVIQRKNNAWGKLAKLITGRNFYIKKWKSKTER